MNADFDDSDSIDPNSVGATITAELQVRLMNLVLGEASDFERDQLQLLMEQRPELAGYYAHLEHLHGLLSEVGAGDPLSDDDASATDDSWRLSADRRAQVLAVLDNPSANKVDQVTLSKNGESKRWRMSRVQAALAITACALVALMLPALNANRMLNATRELASIENAKMTGGTNGRYGFDSEVDEPVTRAPSAQLWNYEPVTSDGAPSSYESQSGSSAGTANKPADTGAKSLLYWKEETVTSIPGFASAKNLGAAVDRTLGNRASSQPSESGLDEESRRRVWIERMRESGMFGGGGGGSTNDSNTRGAVLSTPSTLSASVSTDGVSNDDFGRADDSNTLVVPQVPESFAFHDQRIQGQTDTAKVPSKPSSRWYDNGSSKAADALLSDATRGENAAVASTLGTQPSYSVRAPGEDGITVAVPGFSNNEVEQPYTVYVPVPELSKAGENGRTLLGGSVNAPQAGGRDRNDYKLGIVGGKVVPREAEKQVESLVETYNDMMNKQQFAEAEVVAKQVGLLDSNSPTSSLMRSNARKAIESEQITRSKENGFVKALNSIDFAARPIPDEPSMLLSNRSTERAGAITLSDKPQTETADFDSVNDIVQQTVDPDSWMRSAIEYPPNLSIVVELKQGGQASKPGVPSDHFEASKDIAPLVGKPQNDLLNDTQIEFIDEIDLAIVRGSKRDVEHTMEVIDKLKKSADGEKTQPTEPLAELSQEDSRRQVAKDVPALEGVSKNVLNVREGQVIDLEELENSELRLKASRIFDRSSNQVEAFLPLDRPESGESKDGIATEKGDSKSGESKAGEVVLNGAYVPKLRSEVATGKDGKASHALLSDSDAKEKDKKSGAKGSEGVANKITEDGRLLSEIAKGDQLKLPKSLTETIRARNDEIERARKTGAKQAQKIDEPSAKSEPFSTFSLHISDVAFKLAQTALSQGQWPDAGKIRIEEFVNALDYHDPLPTGNQKVACRVEQAIHPFLMQRNLLRVSMRTAATGRAQNTPLRLTLLLDNSGSMERPDRRQAVLRAFQTLTQQLSATDQITLISFASTPRLLAEKVPGNQGETLLQLIENLPSEGGTNIEAALMLAREKAAEQQVAGAQNRIVLLTDGAVNLGNANPESLAKLVTQMRDSGIAFDAAGISAQDLNDEVLEALTRQGDGRYYLLDSAETVGASFAAQIAGALRPSARNVKVQVEFNPQRVGRYKLLGFEKHRLNKEDFRNDKVDAAEMAAAEAGVAVYQFEVKPNGSGDVGSVSVRFRDLSTGKMVENCWPIPYESNAPRLEQAEPSMQLAVSAALFAAKLSGGAVGDSVDLTLLQKLLAKLPDQCTSQPRVQQLRTMIDQAISIARP